MSHMNSKQLIAISILSVKEGKELPESSMLETDVSKLIVKLIKDFDYLQSNDFFAKTEGKSQQYKDRLIQSLSKPSKIKELKESFLQSVRDIRVNNSVLNFVGKKQTANIQKIRELLSEISS